MKKKLIFLWVLLSIISCSKNTNDKVIIDTHKIEHVEENVILTAENLVGNSYNLDKYHNIEFRTLTNYFIYQKTATCGGYGTWSIANGNVILGSNSSKCEGTRAKEGIYSFSDFE